MKVIPYSRLWNTPAYFDSKKKDLLAMVHQLGLPASFYSFAAGYTHWTPLTQCLGRIVDNKAFDEKYIAEGIPTKDKWQLVASHPAVCCRYFNYRVQTCFTCIMLKENSLFDVMVDYFYRVEFQQRGSPHIHGMDKKCPTV